MIQQVYNLPSSQEEHLVFLKTSKLSIRSVVSNHLEMLTKRRVKKFKSGRGRFGIYSIYIYGSNNNKKPNKDLITDYSADGKFAIYSGFLIKNLSQIV